MRKQKNFGISTGYEPLKELRQSSADTDMIIVDGITPKMSDNVEL